MVQLLPSASRGFPPSALFFGGGKLPKASLQVGGEFHRQGIREIAIRRTMFSRCLGSGNLRASAAHDEPLDQRLRQAGGAHAFLDDGNIVGHAPKLDHLVFQVGDGKSGARIAVARLSDRTGIEEIAAWELDTQRRKRFAGARTNLQDLELRVKVGKTALMMRVPEESDRRGGIEQAIEGLCGSEDVFIFILKRAVNEHDAVGCQRSARQSCQPGEVLGLELRARPIHRGFGDGIEIIGGHQSGDRFVVIAANGLRAELTQARRDFVGIGAIADDITEAHGNIPAVPCGIEDRVKCCSVRVQVAENEDPHS
jgi:hypothetical protein